MNSSHKAKRRGKSNQPIGKSEPTPFLKSAIHEMIAWLGQATFYLAPFVIAIIVSYLAYQDFTVRKLFEGKRWALPARVYANPTEIFTGAHWDPDQFEWLLIQLRYRENSDFSSPGVYSRKGNEFIFRTREFNFWDQIEPSKYLRIRFSERQVGSLMNIEQNKSEALIRLEPVQIGSFYPALKEDRILIKLNQAPDLLLKALFAIEDRNYYEHFGVSIRGMARATWANLRAGGIVQGGSTLTQQLVKNFFLTSERTWWRKINEIVMALILEARYSKEEILEAYLNEIYLGQDGARAIHGFGLASEFYFSRTLNDLELHHIALLVALVRGPSYYDPFKWPEKMKIRRDLILNEMVEQGYLKTQYAAEAKSKTLDIVKNPHQAITRYPAFLDLVKRQLQLEYRFEDLTTEGLHVFTTLDVTVQHHLENSTQTTMTQLDRKTHSTQLEAAAVITRRGSGEIAALLGARDPESAGFNRALDATRQIGSLYKPVVYLTALMNPKKYTLNTWLWDTPIRIKHAGSPAWIPKNYDGQEHGPVLLSTALTHSYNLATVRLGMEVGVENTVKTLRKLGIDKPVEMVPSLLLGVLDLTPLEVARMYQTLASDGFATPLRSIQAVTSQKGKVLQRYALNIKRSINPAAVYLVNQILQEVMRVGTGRSVYVSLPRKLNVAGKTGTTNDLRDSWFAGFSGDYLGVVWIGRDDNQPAKLTGAQGALQVWAATMRQVSKEPLQLDQPSHLETVWIDRRTGHRVNANCPNASPLDFIAGSAPVETSPCDSSQSLVPTTESGNSWFKGLF